MASQSEQSERNRARQGIRVRRVSFPYPDGPGRRHYADGDLMMSHIVAVLSGMFPDGEDFFVRSVRRFADDITDPVLKEQVAGFIGQEVSHGREHRELNVKLARMGYPTPQVEKGTQRGLGFVEKHRSAEYSLAVTAALEHYTATLAEVLLGDERARELLAGSAVRDMLLWHALEESEHKAVAYDVFQHVCGDERIRVRAMRRVTVTFIASVLFRTVLSLLRDPAAYNPARLGRSIFALRHSPYLSGQVVARIRAYFAPGFHPHGVESDALLETWREELFGPAGKLAASLR